MSEAGDSHPVPNTQYPAIPLKTGSPLRFDRHRATRYEMACKWYHMCPLRRFERQGLIDEHWALTYCKSDRHWKACRRYQLEEAGIPHADNLLPDGRTSDRLAAC